VGRVACRTLRIVEKFGAPVPGPQLLLAVALVDGENRLPAHGARIASGRMRGDAHFRPARSGAEAAKLPGFFPALHGEWAEAANDATPAPMDVVAEHLHGSLRRRMGGFIGIQETSNLFGKMQRDYPDLVKEMLRVVAPQRVADVLRRLAEEGVPVRNLRDAFEAITEVGGREKDVVLLTEYVRVALKREIADRYADADRTLHVLLIHPEL